MAGYDTLGKVDIPNKPPGHIHRMLTRSGGCWVGRSEEGMCRMEGLGVVVRVQSAVQCSACSEHAQAHLVEEAQR